MVRAYIGMSGFTAGRHFTLPSVRFHLVPLMIILAFALLVSGKLFTPKFYTSHDGEGHVIRMEEFHNALVDGQFPVRLTRQINYGLGYPFFNFNYPFIYYLGEIFHLTGLSFVSSFKAVMIVSVLLGGVGMYIWTLSHFGRLGAVTSSIFFMLAPYRFLNIYVRGNVAETFALSLIPLVLYAVERLMARLPGSKGLLSLSLTILLLSHNITAVIGLTLTGSYFLFLLKYSKAKLPLVISAAKSVVTALLISMYFWLPLVIETGLTRLVELTGDYKYFFPTLAEVIYSPWGFGPYKQGISPGKMSPQIGLIHQLVAGLSLVLITTRYLRGKTLKPSDKFLLFFLGVALISIFLSLPDSQFLWETVSIIKFVQIPWRFIGYVSLGLAIAAGYVVAALKTKTLQAAVFIGLIILLTYANRNHIRVNQYVDYVSPLSGATVYGPSTTSKDEHMPKWAPRIYSAPNPDGDVLAPAGGKSARLVWKSNYHLFDVTASDSGGFRDNTSYFPGWEAKVDGRGQPIEYQADAFGRLLVYLPAGTHQVEYFFRETPYRLLSDFVSIITLATVLLVVWWRRGLW